MAAKTIDFHSRTTTEFPDSKSSMKTNSGMKSSAKSSPVALPADLVITDKTFDFFSGHVSV